MKLPIKRREFRMLCNLQLLTCTFTINNETYRQLKDLFNNDHVNVLTSCTSFLAEGILRCCPSNTLSTSTILLFAAVIEYTDAPYCFKIDVKVSPLPPKIIKFSELTPFKTGINPISTAKINCSTNSSKL